MTLKMYCCGMKQLELAFLRSASLSVISGKMHTRRKRKYTYFPTDFCPIRRSIALTSIKHSVEIGAGEVTVLSSLSIDTRWNRISNSRGLEPDIGRHGARLRERQSGSEMVDDMKFTVSHVVEPVERGIARINRTFHEISENVKRHEERSIGHKDDSYLIPLSSWNKEFHEVDDVEKGSYSDSTLTNGRWQRGQQSLTHEDLASLEIIEDFAMNDIG
ncbi:LAZ1 homolog 1-like protein isoform X1 [Tanacetum coccineum]